MSVPMQKEVVRVEPNCLICSNSVMFFLDLVDMPSSPASIEASEGCSLKGAEEFLNSMHSTPSDSSVITVFVRCRAEVLGGLYPLNESNLPNS